MQDILFIVQIVIGVVLSATILIQVKGNGFGRVWGGLSTSSSRRGLEGVVFKLTFILTASFVVVSTIALFV